MTQLRAKFGEWSGFSWQRSSHGDALAPLDTVEADSLDVDLGRIAPTQQLFLRLERFRASKGAVLEKASLLAWVEG